MWRKILLLRGQKEVRLSEGLPTLVTFHLFLVGITKIFSELIRPLLKLPTCVLKQQPHILQLCEGHGSAFSLFEEKEQALSAYCHFHHFGSSRKHYIAHGNNAQDCFGITGYSVHHMIRSQVQTITRSILSRNQSPGVSNLQKGQNCE